MNTFVASLAASVLYAVALGPVVLVYLGRERSAAVFLIALLALAILGGFVS
jgi:hypothetical protein